MKKHIFGAALLVAIAVAAGWNYQQNKQDVQLSDLARRTWKRWPVAKGVVTVNGELDIAP